ncbi:MAG: Hpt domain-containing protein, partial [Halanaerobacter sp.]
MSDDQLLQVFIEEANDILADLDTNLIELEDNPHDQNLINQIFRSLHTLKGSASLTGLTDIADFVHHGEDLLDQVRNGELEINSEIINLLLQVHDLVEDMVKEVTTAGFEVDKEAVSEVEESLKFFLNHDSSATPQQVEQESTTEGEQIYKIKLDFNEDLFATGTDPVMLLEELAELGEIIDSNINLTKIPEVYDLNPEKCYLNVTVLLKTDEPREEIEDVFVFVEMDSEIDITNVTDHFDDDLDVSLADKLTGEILVDRGIVEEEDIEEALAQQDKLGDLLEK